MVQSPPTPTSSGCTQLSGQFSTYSAPDVLRCPYAVQTSVGRVRTYGQGGTTIKRRVDVKQAAEALGISSEGVRQRIRRGSIASEKDTGGRVYVFIDEEATNGTPYEPSTDDVVSRLENEVKFLRKELATRDAEIQRRDAVLLSLSEGLKVLNPPPVSPEVRDSSVTPSEEPYSTHAPPTPDRPVERPSWWRRFFGVE